jgi:CubicO group peptidase (beta-lactamase class C family)
MKEKTEVLIQAAINRAVEAHDVGGMNVLVTQNGKDRWYCQSGMLDIRKNQKLERDAIFRCYSMSKPVTAVAAMMLVERGLLDFDEPVFNYLPGFKDQHVAVEDEHDAGEDVSPYKAQLLAEPGGDYRNAASAPSESPVTSPVTIKNLLTMTSGLPYPDPDHIAGRGAGEVMDIVQRDLLTDHALGTVDVANRLGRQPLRFQPGRHWMYGTSADVLGAVIEVASGQRFGDFLRTEIFEPLGMKDTAFYVPPEKQGRLGAIYENSASPLEPYESGTDIPGTNLREVTPSRHGVIYRGDSDPAYQSGGAGLFSTLDDYSHLGHMLLQEGNYGAVRLLSEATVRYMTRNALLGQPKTDYESWQHGYGYNSLMRILERPSMSYVMGTAGEYGWDGWLGTYFTNLPAENATMLVGMQLFNGSVTQTTRKVHNIVTAALHD